VSLTCFVNTEKDVKYNVLPLIFDATHYDKIFLLLSKTFYKFFQVISEFILYIAKFSLYFDENQWRIQKFWRGRWQKAMCQSAPSYFIANARNELYRKRRLTNNRGGPLNPPPFTFILYLHQCFPLPAWVASLTSPVGQHCMTVFGSIINKLFCILCWSGVWHFSVSNQHGKCYQRSPWRRQSCSYFSAYVTDRLSAM